LEAKAMNFGFHFRSGDNFSLAFLNSKLSVGNFGGLLSTLRTAVSWVGLCAYGITAQRMFPYSGCRGYRSAVVERILHEGKKVAEPTLKDWAVGMLIIAGFAMACG